MSVFNRLPAKNLAARICAVAFFTFGVITYLFAPTAQAGAPDAATLETEIQSFLGSESGYDHVDVEQLEATLEATLPPADSVFLASGSLSAFAKAMLVLETTEGPLERTRHHLTTRVLSVEEPPANDLAPYLFVQLDRYNLGPAVRNELVSSLGVEHVAPLSEFGEGPHVSWRFVMHQVMGQNAAIFAAGRTQLDVGQVDAATCLGVPCLSTTGGIEELAVWHELEPAELGIELERLPFEALRAGLPTSAAMVDLAAGIVHFNPYEAETGRSDRVFAEFLVVSGLTQEPSVELAFRQGELLDDSVAAIWQRLVAFSPMGDTPEYYEAQAYECRRGEGGLAEPGEFCL